jgi:nucleoside-diphosphate-sugar epimerase
MKPNILFTGKTGFIGRNITQDYDFIDLKSDENTWGLKGYDCIIHLAGLAHGQFSYQDYQSVNVDLTLTLAKRAIFFGVSRFVFISTMNISWLELAGEPFDAATSSKYQAECALADLSKASDLEIVIVRVPLVYGSEAPGKFGTLSKLVKALPFLPFGLSDNKRDFMAVQNLADLLLTCAKHPNAAGHTFLASDGETVSIKAFTNAIAKGLNKTLIQLPIPISLMRLAALIMGKSAMAEQLLGNLQVDSSIVQDVLGWTPPYTMAQSMSSLSRNKK